MEQLDRGRRTAWPPWRPGRPAEQDLRVGAVVGVDGHADRGVHVQGERADLHRLLQRRRAAPWPAPAASCTSGSRSVTTNSSPPTRPDQRGRPAPGAAAGCATSAEHLVAGGVAERLVDVAQPVDVEQQHRDDLAGRAHLDRLVERAGEPAAVGQPGQRVVVRVEAQPVDQPGVLHRDGGVRGERLQQPHVGRRRRRSRSPSRPATSSVPITAGPERSGTTMASLVPASRSAARSAVVAVPGPDGDRLAGRQRPARAARRASARRRAGRRRRPGR